ncbi:MAG TPA: DUF1559 domain-containing protein [Pirellulales bacterium]|jgi:hypothetical protein|nr:DUF1559 domain-containing protein [Pirellulales bacterium]
MLARCDRYAATLILILLAAGCTERATLAAEETDGPAAVESEPPWRGKPDPVTSAVVRKFLDLNVALWKYKDAHQRFPAAATHGQDGQPLLSWRVELLPFLGEKELYDQFHHDEPWDSEHNKPLVAKMPAAFHSPRVGDLDGKTVFLVPTGEETMFFDDQGTTEEQIIDGLNKTISIVEVDAEHAVLWTRPADFRVDKRKPDAGLARDRAGAFVVGEASGLALMLLGDTDTATLWSLFTPAGGEEIELPCGSSESGFLAASDEADSDVDRAGDEEKQVVTDTKGDPATDAVQSKFLALEEAMWKYRSVHQRFPPAATHGQDGRPLLSWRVELLPYLGQMDLYLKFRHNEPWDSKHNKRLLNKMPEVFSSPRVGDLEGKTVFLVPTGEETMFFDDQGTTTQQITDGLRSTISIVEVDAEHAVPWTRPADFPVDKQKPDAGLARDRAGALTVAEACSMTLTLPAGTDNATLWSLFTRAGGEKIGTPLGNEAGRGSTEDDLDVLDDIDDAGGTIGQPAEVVAEFKSSPEPLPPGIEEKVAEKLHRIALALKDAADPNELSPPAAICDASGKPLLSWRVKLLRDLDEEALYDQFHLDEPWDSPHNLPLVKKMPYVYLHPKVGRLDGKTVFLRPIHKSTGHFEDNGKVREETLLGLSSTIPVVVADAEHAVPWTKPDDLLLDDSSPTRGLERWPDHFFMMALADAQILLLPDNIEPNKLEGFFTRAGMLYVRSPQDPGQDR